MDVTFKTDAILIGDQEQALITNLQITQAELQAALQKLALVAMADLLDMATGRARERLSTDAYQKRLEYMILYYYGDRLPREDEIVRLFQVTPLRAKTLLTNVQAARRFSIEPQFKETVARALRTAKKPQHDATNVVLSISSVSVFGAIKTAIEASAIGEGYGSISKHADTVDEYEMSVLTFNKIAPEFGVASIA
jgi:hypothetical protein